MRTIFRTVVALGAVLAWSATAQAALSISGPASYTPGDSIVITLTGDSEGQNPTGLIRAILGHSALISPTASSQGVLNSTNPGNPWLHTGTSGNHAAGCGTGGLAANECAALDAFDSYTLGSGMIGLLPSTLSTYTFDTTGASGDLTFTLTPEGAGFFGFGPATPLVVAQIVPEPASAALLGLGLMTLGLMGRRR